MRRYVILFVLLLGLIKVNAQKSILEEINLNLSSIADTGKKTEAIAAPASMKQNATSDSVKAKTTRDSIAMALGMNQNKDVSEEQDTQLFQERMVAVKRPAVSTSSVSHFTKICNSSRKNDAT